MITCASSHGLRPQGVGSGGFESSVLRWFAIVLSVLILVVSHVTVLASEPVKEVHMEKANAYQIGTLNKSRLFLSSLITTMWAIGTSEVAGALSA